MRLREPSSVSFSLTVPVFLPLAGSDWKQEAAGGRGFWEAAAGAEGTAAPPAGQADGAGAADMEGEGRVSFQTLWGSGPAGSPGQGTGGEVSAASKWASASERHPTSSWDRRGSPQEGGLEDAGERQEREAEMCDERDWWLLEAQGGYRDEVPEGLDDFPMSHTVVMTKGFGVWWSWASVSALPAVWHWQIS